MSSIATQLVDAIALSSSKLFGVDENRLSKYPILGDAATMQQIVDSSELQVLRKTTGRPVKIPTVNKGNIVLGGSRACTITGTEGTSAMTLVTFVTRTAAFKMVLDKFADNYITYEQELASRMTDVRRALYAQMETDIVAALELNKAQANAHPLFNALTFQLEVPNADKESLYDIFRTMMELNDYYGDYNVYSNTGSRDLQEFLSRQGTNNATNLSPQLNMLNLMRSNRITNGVGAVETHFITPKGRVAFVPWNFVRQKQNIQGSLLDATIIVPQVDYWLTQADDMFPDNAPVDFDIHFKRECSITALDGTRNSGSPATVDTIEVSLDYAILTPYHSTTPLDTSIFKAVLLA